MIFKNKWMKYYQLPTVLILVTVMFSLLGFTDKNMKDYKTYWKEVAALEQKRLPASALELVEEIYKKAQEENNHVQLTKSFIYKAKYTLALNEDGYDQVVLLFEQEISSAKAPRKQVLQSILASMYSGYLQSNMYAINQRTDRAEKNNKDSKTWSVRAFHTRISALYKASIADPNNTNYPVADYKEILTAYNTEFKEYIPELYDVLVNRALEYFKNPNSYVTDPAYKFSINDPIYFSNVDAFVGHKIENKDTSSLLRNAIDIYQEKLSWNKKKSKSLALAETNISRLDFVYQNAIMSNKEELYLDALHILEDNYRSMPQYADVMYRLANYYVQKANTYRSQGKYIGPNDYYVKAKSFCEKAISAFPKTEGSNGCRGIYNNILNKEISFSGEFVHPTNSSALISVRTRNIEQVYTKIVRLSEAETEKYYRDRDHDKKLSFLLSRTEVDNDRVALPDNSKHYAVNAEIALPGLPSGMYALIISDGERFSNSKNGIAAEIFHISDLAYAVESRDSYLHVIVTDRVSGAALNNVSIDISKQYYDRKERRQLTKELDVIRTDMEGVAQFKFPKDKNTRLSLRLQKGEDILSLQHAHNNNNYQSSVDRRTIFHIFTDRAIYRPGQLIYFKALATKNNSEGMPEILPDTEATISLRDANNQEVQKLQLKTNAYGSLSGSFTAPADGLKGRMNLQVVSEGGRSSKSVSVEEYKRPKFYVEIDKLTEAYQLNENITTNIKAKTYAGSNLDGADVKYRVTRSSTFPYYSRGGWMPYYNTQEMEIMNGEGVLDASGSFEIVFSALADEQIDKKYKPSFNYRITADVTDLNGETQSTVTNVKIGYQSILLSTNLSQEMDIEAIDSILVNAKNLNGTALDVEGKLTIYKMISPAGIYNKRYWNFPDTILISEAEFARNHTHYSYNKNQDYSDWRQGGQVLKESFVTPENAKIDIKNSLAAGVYKILLETTEKDGSTIAQEEYVIIKDHGNGAFPNLQHLFVKELKTDYQPGEVVHLELGVPKQTIHVYYKVEKANKIVDQGWKQVSDKSSIKIPVTEKDRGGFKVQLFYFKNNRYYQMEIPVLVSWSNKDLTIHYETFRSELLPGGEEEFRIIISGKNKEKVSAEFLATMYDASLDAFVPHKWNQSFFPKYSSYSRVDFPGYNSIYGRLHTQFQQQEKYSYIKLQKTLPRLNIFGLPMYYQARGRMMRRSSGRYEDDGGAPMMSESITMDEVQALPTKSVNAIAASSAGLSSDKGMSGDLDIANISKPLATPSTDESSFSVRTNLKETVFFYPDLETDDEGNLVLKFKMNEALTKWKLISFAHDKELRYGFDVREVVTKKDLMVFPNPPRFFRDKDEIVFSSKVSNLSSGDIDAVVELSLVDAISGEPVGTLVGLKDKAKQIVVPAGQSKVVSWKLNIPTRALDAITFRVVARGKDMSDGEEATVPVLTDMLLVTETMPLTVKGKEEKRFVFKAMEEKKSSTLKHHNFAIEYTSNPAWYAIQALPYIMDYPYDCTEQVFNRFYANSLASHISNKNPKIQKVFDQWKLQDSDALVSSLSKNEELKSALIAETPWLQDALSETEQKKNIALLFDMNKMAQEKNKSLKVLRERQLADGGFAWFDGGRANRYISQYLLEGIGHLRKMNVITEEEDLQIILGSALSYIDDKLQEEYNQLLKQKANLSKDNLSYIAAHYLYARSFFPEIKIKESAQTAYNYYLEQADKYAIKRGIYHSGMLAIALNRYDKKEAAVGITKSLLERSLEHEELGRYWNEGNGYNWHELPIERHALMIELMAEMGESKDLLNELKLWLLRNKQTNNWKTTKATAAAIYGLLITGEQEGISTWILESVDPEISMNGKKLDFENQAELATGYIKKSYAANEIENQIGAVEIKNNNDHIGWGSMYWQYFEQMDKVKQADNTPLKLVKQLYKVVLNDTGEQLVPIADADIQIGDKLKVRIELTVDRKMEFVHMKDMRASGLEPINVISRYKWNHGLGYYESTGDTATDFFFDYLPKGSYVFEYPLRVQHEGVFSNGICTIQSMYAPEYASHSKGSVVEVVESK